MSDLAQILEDFQVWKRNSPFLYDMVLMHGLEWPSLTVQWIHDEKKQISEDKEFSTQKVILGTHASEGEQNHLIVAEMSLPTAEAEIDATKFEETEDFGGFAGKEHKFNIIANIPHEGEINRARYMWQNSEIVATYSVSGDVLLFNWKKAMNEEAKEESKEDETEKVDKDKPFARLIGLQQQGFGLGWSYTKKGFVAAGGDSGEIACWNTFEKGGDLKPEFKFNHFPEGSEPCAINEVTWHKSKDIFASAGDDGYVVLVDANTGKIIHRFLAHEGGCGCVDFAPFDDKHFITCGNDSRAKLWDMTKLSESHDPLHIFEGHEGDVNMVNYSPFSDSIFATTGDDRRVGVWDTSRIGNEQDEEDAEDGAPELLFLHSGHTAEVQDVSWNSNEDEEFVIASVGNDNLIQVWQLASTIYDPNVEDTDGYGDSDEDDLE
eukprot:TRINITY_DN677_c0_g1_i2.p1 TRINITY_DN677_c0_g1~~TRINITY_DN677_c0_g1_i2.p1  ORF type:complete len:443 (+),score=162.50 TRINITY_DN677_c0_g1_i2:28-1329(+)